MRKAVTWAGVSALMVGAAVALSNGGAAIAAEGAVVESESSLVEDFAYPGADRILAEHGLTLLTGDGHVTFEPAKLEKCAEGLIKVTTMFDAPPFGADYCFRTSGARGFLTLRVPNSFVVRAGSTPVDATAQLPNGETKTFDVPVDKAVTIDPGNGNEVPQTILVELRFGEW